MFEEFGVHIKFNTGEMNEFSKTPNLRIPGILALLLLSMFSLSAQDIVSNGKAFNFPFRKYGISLGNSYEFNGVRLNLADHNVKRINGLNITAWIKLFKNENAIVNGISAGVMPTAGILQPISLGVIGLGTSGQSNGLNVGGLIIGGDVNGLSLSGLIIMADGARGRISGIAMTGLAIGAKSEINGVALGGLIVGTDGNINGFAASTAYIGSKGIIRGFTITPGYLNASFYNGVTIAAYSRSTQMNGLSIAIFNYTKELKGIQLGLLNIAKNNPKGLRLLPVFNVHL
jgi:hypothetical protein